MQRLLNITQQLNYPSSVPLHSELKTEDRGGQDASNPIRWDGWGYRDTSFSLNPQGQVALTGDRYLFSGKVLPSLRAWLETQAGLDIKLTSPTQKNPKVPPAIQNDKFVEAIKGNYKAISFSPQDRLFHGHGHTCQEIWTLRFGAFKRVPDAVVYPGSHEHVEAIVKAANEHNVVIIPFGGGTSVSQGLLCPENEKRMIVSLDMHRMCAIKWVDRKSMLACIEAGAVGKDIEKKLELYGLCLGHEPDSAEFSTLGGWVATRASGMRKNKYGNIEDIVRKIKLVTPIGTLEKSVAVPRMAAGPDLHHVVLGSEGTFGVVTEAVVRVSEKPAVSRYGSIIFPNLELGVNFMYEVAMKKCAPVSVRLVDNVQFQFGQALKPGKEGWIIPVMDKIKKWYVLNRLKFDANNMVAATLTFEGGKEEVERQEKKIYEIANKYGGVKGGEENGKSGYFLTYMIAYLRDFGFEYTFIAESFETSVPWDSVVPVCHNVRTKIYESAKEKGISPAPLVSCRVTQTYDTGACVYFYFGFVWKGLKDPAATFSIIEHEARDEILKVGGSISHHHGIGKLRKHWLPETVSHTGVTVLRGLKQTFDPKNIFGNNNIIDLISEGGEGATKH